MPRHHATSEGNIPFTAAEELERDAEEAAHIAAKPELDRLAFNATIHAQLVAADLTIIRALAEGDTARIATHKAAQATLRAGLR